MAENRKREQGEATRERVLLAASDLMARKGYAATSISEISKAAGVHPPSIYWAFVSKEGLLAAVMERAAASWFVEQLANVDFSSEPAVWETIRSLSGAFDQQPEFLRLLLLLSLECRQADDSLLEPARRVRELAMAAFVAALEPHVPVRAAHARRSVSEDVARLLIMLLDGAFIARQIDPDSTDVDHLFDLILVALQSSMHALAAESPSNRPRTRSAAATSTPATATRPARAPATRATAANTMKAANLNEPTGKPNRPPAKPGARV